MRYASKPATTATTSAATRSVHHQPRSRKQSRPTIAQERHGGADRAQGRVAFERGAAESHADAAFGDGQGDEHGERDSRSDESERRACPAWTHGERVERCRRRARRSSGTRQPPPPCRLVSRPRGRRGGGGARPENARSARRSPTGRRAPPGPRRRPRGSRRGARRPERSRPRGLPRPRRGDQDQRPLEEPRPCRPLGSTGATVVHVRRPGAMAAGARLARSGAALMRARARRRRPDRRR